MKLLTTINARASNAVEAERNNVQDQNRTKNIKIDEKEKEEQEELNVRKEANSKQKKGYTKRKELVAEEERIDKRKKEIANNKRNKTSPINNASTKCRNSLNCSTINKQELERLKEDSRKINQNQFILVQGKIGRAHV